LVREVIQKEDSEELLADEMQPLVVQLELVLLLVLEMHWQSK
jgi:hypothetical protein